MSRVAVVGAGQSGLICAQRLASSGLQVSVIERLPALGGSEPEESTAGFARAARTAGARLEPGTTAVSFENGTLHTIGVGGAGTHVIDALVVATGTRPATRAELQIDGDRCAGVVPGSVAIHVTASGVLLGLNPVVVGGGQLASECAGRLMRAGARRVRVIAPDGLRTEFAAGAEVRCGCKVRTIRGRQRVCGVVLDCPGETLPCDAVILAHQRRPTRNIEGAIVDTPGVVFCHSSADPKLVADASHVAEAAANEVLKSLKAFVA